MSLTKSASSLNWVVERLKRQPIQKRLIIFTALATVIPLLRWIYHDYISFVSLGRGGVPNNIIGYLLVTLLIRPFALSRKARLKTSDYPSLGASADILALPTRQGEPADIQGIIPHRQMNQNSPKELKARVSELFKDVVARNPDIFEIRKSLYERHNDAVFIRQSVLNDPDSHAPPTAITSRGEICHMHNDGSIHLYLSPADAKIAIEKGWAERHGLARPKPPFSWLGQTKPLLAVASTYLLFSGPRDEVEFEVFQTFLREGLKYMVGQQIA